MLVCVWAPVSRPCSLTDGRRAVGPGLRGGLKMWPHGTLALPEQCGLAVASGGFLRSAFLPW